MYNKRTWLNKEGSDYTGSVVAFDGETFWHGEKFRNTFLQISDCDSSIRLHKKDADTETDMADFIDKMKLLKSEIELFINHLEANQ